TAAGGVTHAVVHVHGVNPVAETEGARGALADVDADRVPRLQHQLAVDLVDTGQRVHREGVAPLVVGGPVRSSPRVLHDQALDVDRRLPDVADVDVLLVTVPEPVGPDGVVADLPDHQAVDVPPRRRVGGGRGESHQQ